jgi:hypothetical protein
MHCPLIFKFFTFLDIFLKIRTEVGTKAKGFGPFVSLFPKV